MVQALLRYVYDGRMGHARVVVSILDEQANGCPLNRP